MSNKNVMLWTGTGQIGMAIARRIGYGMKIIAADRNPKNAQSAAKIMNEAQKKFYPRQSDFFLQKPPWI